MSYQVWDLVGGSIADECATEAGAMSILRAALQEIGRDYVAELALSEVDAAGHMRLIAMGDDLIERLTRE